MHPDHRDGNGGRDRRAEARDGDRYPVGACQRPPVSQEKAPKTAARMRDEEKCRKRIMRNQSRIP